MSRLLTKGLSIMKLSPWLVPSLALAACSAQEPPRSPHNVEIRTAALNLPGIGYACYDLEVRNDLGQVVWSQGTASAEAQSPSICSNQYGNAAGGDIGYIGPCDATDANATDGGDAMNTVTLWVDGLYSATTNLDVGEYQNPCRWPDGCKLTFECVENSDVLVTFNLTIMREANQGFFDIAVNFDDIFCSAKVDCADDDGPSELLFHPGTNQRAQTAVLALACTAGPATSAESPNDTVLFRNPIVVDCGATQTVLDPTLGAGNVYTASNPDPDLTDSIWQYATYFGTEELTCNGLPCNKRYWNVAIGFDPSTPSCTLTTSATAAHATAMPEHDTPEASTYPWIDIAVDLTGPTGGLACSQHPLNGTVAGVSTAYTPVDEPMTFCHRYDGSAFTSGCVPPCEPGDSKLTDHLGTVMCIAPGLVTVGCLWDRDNSCVTLERPTYYATLTRGLQVMESEVTQGQWQAVFGNNPSAFTSCGLNCPVEQVNWWDSVAFANEVSIREGLAPCYTLLGCTGLPGVDLNCVGVTINAPGGDTHACEGYRLPTEAEWEYIARGGEDYPSTRYAGSNDVNAVGWYSGNNTPNGTKQVCQKLRNGYGLCDLSGNVFEWVWDWYGVYTSTSKTDPMGPSEDINCNLGTCIHRVCKGGRWGAGANILRIAQRARYTAEHKSNDRGFRLVRTN